MEAISPFKSEWIPHHSIVVAVTTEEDCCDTQRYLLAEHQPGVGQYTLIEGGHCSCYEFEDIDWTATIYEHDEIVKLLSAWWREHLTVYERHQREFAGLAALSCFYYRNPKAFPGLQEWWWGDKRKWQSEPHEGAG